MVGLAWLLTVLVAPPVVSGDLELRSAPVWLADGRLAVIGRLADETAWYLCSRRGAPPEVLRPTPPQTAVSWSWWSPTGDRLAYLADTRDGRLLHVLTLGRERATPYALIGELREPVVAWSPDGERLGFTRVADAGASQPYEIFVIAAGGAGEMARVAAPLPPRSLAWSHNPQQFAYVVATGDRLNLFVCDLSARVAVACSSHLDVLPRSLAWAPGDHLVYFAGSGDLRQGARLFGSVTDGSQPAQRVPFVGYPPERPVVWSPDGTRAAWVAGVRSAPEPGTLHLADGPELANPRPLDRTLSRCVGPTFSPDSRWLAVTVRPAGARPYVTIRPAAGGPEVARYQDPAGLDTPVWSPAGDALAVTTAVGPRRLQVVPFVAPDR